MGRPSTNIIKIISDVYSLYSLPNTMNKLFRTVLVTGTLCVSFLFVGSALASAYEWMANYYFNGYPPEIRTVVQSGNYEKIHYTVLTSGNYYEYRSSYYAIGDLMPTSSAGWTEWNTCRFSGYVNTSTQDVCYPQIPTVGTTSTLWVRSTTNYAGCGSYTPEPDIANCGYKMTASSTVTP